MKRKRKATGLATERQVLPDLVDQAWSGYSGARWSGDRGHLFWPTLDTRRELDSFSRDELMRRIRCLKANVGFVKGIISNAAVLVGYQTIQAASGDEAWDDLAENVFYDRALTPEVFDHAGKWDFEEAQLGLSRARFGDGDSLAVLGEWQNGAAKLAFYEAHQLRSPDVDETDGKWVNGVRLGPGGRHLAYGLWDAETGNVSVIPARDAIYNGRFDSSGHVRAVPPLAHAVNHATDITEVWQFLKKAIKVSSLYGAVRELDGQAQPRSREGLAGPRRVIEQSDGSKVEVNMAWEGGMIPRLDPGEKMKILTDNRPSPEVRALLDDLIRDIAMGFGVPPEVVWHMVSLTGPGVRFIMDFAARWIQDQNRLQQRFARRCWVYFLAKEIKAGRLGLPKTGRWWACEFTPQRSLTIDRGRESKSRLDELDAGVGTWEQWEEIDGKNWRDRTRQRIREVKFAMAECETEGVPYERVYPGRPGQAPVAGGKMVETKEEDL